MSAGGGGADASGSSLLARLRSQAEGIREQQQSAERPLVEAAQRIDESLVRAVRWLEEVLAHLEVIRPPVTHAFQLTELIRVVAPRFEQGFVTSRRYLKGGHDLTEQIEVFYRLAGDKPIAIRVPHGASSAMDDQLRFAQLKFRYLPEAEDARGVRYGVFTIEPVVAATIRIIPDYDARELAMTLRNVDRVETLSLALPGEALNESALEDLVKLMLGESAAFVRRGRVIGVGAPAGK